MRRILFSSLTLLMMNTVTSSAQGQVSFGFTLGRQPSVVIQPYPYYGYSYGYSRYSHPYQSGYDWGYSNINPWHNSRRLQDWTPYEYGYYPLGKTYPNYQNYPSYPSYPSESYYRYERRTYTVPPSYYRSW